VLGLFSLQTMWGETGDMEVLARMGAWTADDGPSQPWRMLSHAWLHGSFPHFAANLLALVAFGWPLERVIGWRRWLLLYTAGVLGGGLVSAVLEQPNMMVGASGGIFALWAALAALAVSPREMLHGAEVGTLREALWPLGLAMALQSAMPGISWGAHLGGLIVGLTAGLSGLLIAGLAPRAPRRSTWESNIPRLSWMRAATATIVVGGLACCFTWVATVLLLAYLLVFGLIARREPRYAAQDGWRVTLGAFAAASLLWGAGAVAVLLGTPWDVQPGAHWLEPGPDLLTVQVPFRSRFDSETGIVFGQPGHPSRVEISLIEEVPEDTFAARWAWVAAHVAGTLQDEAGCPVLSAPGEVLVLTPTKAVLIRAWDASGPIAPVFELPVGCPPLSVADRVAARRAHGDEESAARLAIAHEPDDPVAQIAVMAFDLPCADRLAALAERIAADPTLLRVAARAALSCPGRQPARWAHAAVTAEPDDPRAWQISADLAEHRGDDKGLRRALNELVRTTSGVAQREAQRRLRALDQ